jgi:hypothetical protein
MGAFASQISRYKLTTEMKIERVRRAIIIELFSSVIMSTPVLTGRLRGNWQATVGHPATEEIVARGEGVPQGSVPPEMMAEINQVALSIHHSDKSAFLRNNLPYARRVEYEGWSQIKAPQGMLRLNVVRVVANANKILSEAQRGA